MTFAHFEGNSRTRKDAREKKERKLYFLVEHWLFFYLSNVKKMKQKNLFHVVVFTLCCRDDAEEPRLSPPANQPQQPSQQQPNVIDLASVPLPVGKAPPPSAPTAPLKAPPTASIAPSLAPMGDAGEETAEGKRSKKKKKKKKKQKEEERNSLYYEVKTSFCAVSAFISQRLMLHVTPC